MAVNIKVATATDKEACIELLQDFTASTGEPLSSAAGDAFDGLLEGERGEIFLAEDDGELLGLASVTYNLAMRYGGEYCQLEEVVVDLAARGKGVGALLMETAISQARERGCLAVGAYVVDANADARSFYEKFGLKAVGTEMRLDIHNPAPH